MSKLKGHENCGVSTGIHECLTFGSGKLDKNGFWEIPCYECARNYEKQNPYSGPCWPHTDEQFKIFKKNNKEGE